MGFEGRWFISTNGQPSEPGKRSPLQAPCSSIDEHNGCQLQIGVRLRVVGHQPDLLVKMRIRFLDATSLEQSDAERVARVGDVM